MLIDPGIMLGLLAASISLLILAPDWRPALVLLGVCGGLVLTFEQREFGTLQSPEGAPIVTLLAAINVVASLVAGLIVLWTGLTYHRPYEQGAGDEVSKMHLRRDVRRAARAAVPRGWKAYRAPVFGLVLLAAGTLLLPPSYPSPARVTSYAWTLLVLGGLLTAVTSDTLLKLAMGLLLIAFGLRLGYLAEVAAIGVFDVALLSVVPIVVALAMGLLSSLAFGRLGTLRLALLFEQARPNPTRDDTSVVPTDTVIANERR